MQAPENYVQPQYYQPPVTIIQFPSGIKGRAMKINNKISLKANVIIVIVGLLALFYFYSQNGLFSLPTMLIAAVVIFWAYITYKTWKFTSHE